jgi:hypothetical protein
MSEDDFDVLDDGGVVALIFKANVAPVGIMDVDVGLRSSRRSIDHVRPRREPRGRHGRLCQELAAAMTAGQGGCPNLEHFLSQ